MKKPTLKEKLQMIGVIILCVLFLVMLLALPFGKLFYDDAEPKQGLIIISTVILLLIFFGIIFLLIEKLLPNSKVGKKINNIIKVLTEILGGILMGA
jgi:NADH:ubiquinone oxidoreductase subunit 6 (subunit J)